MPPRLSGTCFKISALFSREAWGGATSPSGAGSATSALWTAPRTPPPPHPPQAREAADLGAEPEEAAY